jgi:rRNA-processing protein FCF1
LVVTNRYLALGAVTPEAAANEMVRDELDRLVADLRALAGELGTMQSRWAGNGQIVVPDTNIFLHHRQEFPDIDWIEVVGGDRDSEQPAHVVVPLIVVDELDNLKRRGSTEVKTRARLALRSIDDLFKGRAPEARVVLRPEISTSVTVELLIDRLDHVRLADADSEIVDRALEVGQSAGQQVVVYTADTGMAVRCHAAGLKAIRYLEPLA